MPAIPTAPGEGTATATTWPSPAVFRALCSVLALGLVLQLVTAITQLSISSDEHTHLPSGYTYLKTGDFRLNPQHPPLIKELCALPLLWLQPRLDLSDPAWVQGAEWTFGDHFLYRQDADTLITAGRLPVVLLALLLLGYALTWSTRLWGRAGGLLTALLCVTCPNLLAHACLVTTDVGVSAFLLMAHFHLWAQTRQPGWKHVLLAGLGLGLALASKFSALVALPSFLVLLVLARDGSFMARLQGVIRSMIPILAVALAVLFCAYGFSPRFLQMYVDGIQAVQADHVAAHPAYLLGHFSTSGFPGYFLAAFIMKTPVVTLMLTAGMVVFHRRLPQTREAFLWVLPLLFLVVISLAAHNYGVRYILPIFPFLYVALGRVGPVLAETLRGRVMAVPLVLGLVTAGPGSWPSYLSFFSEWTGGTTRGHLFLDDSNMDWGEGLKRLKTFLDDHAINHVQLLYPWPGHPEHYGISYDRMSEGDLFMEPRPGVYVISTQAFIRLGLLPIPPGGHVPWPLRAPQSARVDGAFFVFEVAGPSGG